MPTAEQSKPKCRSAWGGSEDPATALAELRPQPALRRATVGSWTTARALRFLDLLNVDVPSLFDLVGKRQRPWRLFLKGFADDVSLPPSPGREAVDYVPTQVFTEYVRHVLGGSGDPVRGIRYRSAMRPEGASWVLFLDHTACTDASSGWKCNPRALVGPPALLAAALRGDAGSAGMAGDPLSDTEGLPMLRPTVLPAGFDRALDNDAKVDPEEALTEEERWFAERSGAAKTRRA